MSDNENVLRKIIEVQRDTIDFKIDTIALLEDQIRMLKDINLSEKNILKLKIDKLEWELKNK